MKYLLHSVIALFFCFQALAEPIAGTLEKSGTTTFITLSSTAEKYQILTTIGDATEGLRKLESGDFITGNATLNQANKTLQLESVDYVGLKKLLGLWYSGENVMNFSSFSNLSVYPVFNVGRTTAPDVSIKADFRYSTAPLAGSGAQWAVFLSNRDSTVFATIEFASGKTDNLSDFATLRTYNVETGGADRTIRLIRWSK